MKAAWSDKECYYLLYHYALNGDLAKLLAEHGALKIEAARFFAANIVNGLDYLRKSRVVHRDLKPDNIVLNEDWKPQLADFGSSKAYNEDGHSITNYSANTVSDNASYSQCPSFYN